LKIEKEEAKKAEKNQLKNAECVMWDV